MQQLPPIGIVFASRCPIVSHLSARSQATFWCPLVVRQSIGEHMLSNTRRRLRMLIEGRLNNTQIAELTNCTRNTVRNWRERVSQLELTYDQLDEHDDQELAQLITPGRFSRNFALCDPNFEKVRHEHEENGVTLQLLYEEYLERVPETESAMGRSTFYEKFSEFCQKTATVQSFVYSAGEMLQFDFAGNKSRKRPQLFNTNDQPITYEVGVAAMALSKKFFVKALPDQSILSVVKFFNEAFAFFGGVPVLVTIDNFKAAIQEPRRRGGEGIPTNAFQALSDHYGFGISAARVRKPRDKGIAENSVGITQNSILAPLRKRRFFSFSDLNSAILEKLEIVNSRPMMGQTHESRNDRHERLEVSGYKPLPTQPYENGKWIIGIQVGPSYSIRVNGTQYSVPHRFVGETINIKTTVSSVQVFHSGRVVWTHVRQDEADNPIIEPSHMPETHREASNLRLSGLKSYVHEIGPHAEHLIELHYRNARKPRATSQAANQLVSLLSDYEVSRVEKACKKAIELGEANPTGVARLLRRGLEDFYPEEAKQKNPPNTAGNVRGAQYFGDILDSKNNRPENE